MQELEVRASQQAQLIHADLAAEVACSKQQHFEELAATKSRCTESV